MLALQRSAGNRATIALLATPGAPPHPGRVLARTKAEVTMQPGRILGQHSQGKGGQGGVSHCEQRSWAQARGAVEQRFKANEDAEIPVTFSVDQKICEQCQDWFENDLYPTLSGWAAANPRNGRPRAFRLVVEVGGATAEVLGAGQTGWSAEVGDVERKTPAEQLREKVASMGLDFGGQRAEPLEGDDDATLLEHQVEIDDAHAEWLRFLKRGGAQQTGKDTKGDDVTAILKGKVDGKIDHTGDWAAGESGADVEKYERAKAKAASS